MTSSPVFATPYFGSVTNLAAVRYSATKIKLTWTAVSGRTEYEIYRSTAPDGEFALIGSASYTYFYSGSLTTRTTYYYMIRAYRTVNGVRYYSGYSTVVSAMP